MRTLIIFLIFFASFGSVLLADDSFTLQNVRIMEVSESGQSLIIDAGRYKGVEKGERGRFLLQKGTGNPKIDSIAYGEVLKVYDNYSFWYLKKVQNKDAIKPGSRIQFVREKVNLRGIRPFYLKKRMVFGDGSKRIPDKLIEKESKYYKSKKLNKTHIDSAYDLETVSLKKWKYGQSRRDVEYKDIPEYEEVVSHEKKRVFQEMTDGTLTEINKQKTGLRSLYRESAVDKDVRIFKEASDFPSVYDNLRQIRRDEQKVSKQVTQKIKDQGEMWTADMSDEEIREVVVTTGIEEALRRQKRSLEEKSGHELFFTYGMGISDNTDSEDPINKGQTYLVSFGYEFHLMKTSQALKKWGVDFSLVNGLQYYDSGAYNVTAKERYYKIGLNYYFYNNPSKLRKYIWFVGAYGIMGDSIVTSSRFQSKNQYFYEIGFTPGYRLGMKYRFSGGEELDQNLPFGFGFSLLYEMEKRRLVAGEMPESGMNSEIYANVQQVSLGFNIFF